MPRYGGMACKTFCFCAAKGTPKRHTNSDKSINHNNCII